MQAGAAKNLRKFIFWQMAVFNKILKDCRGSIGTAVLAGILCAAVCLHAAAYWVRQEAEENSRRILRRQLQFAVQALAKAGFENGSLPEGGINLPPQKLQPGNYTLKAGIFEENTSGGIKKYTVQAEAGGETFALQQIRIILPQQVTELGKRYTLAAGKSLQGTENLPEGIAYGGELGEILQSLDVKNFAAFKEMDFPTRSTFEEYGLGGALYYDGNYSKSIASSSKNIKGEGVLVSKMSIFIADGTKIPGFCVIISDGQIEIGKNAVLGKALLLSKYDITVKSGACVNGIALCDGRLIIEDGVMFTRDESVLQPFVTAYRLKQQ